MVLLASPIIDGTILDAFYVSSGSMFLTGRPVQILNAGASLVPRAGTEAVRVNGVDIPVDFAKVNPSDQDEARNTNAAVSCGVGKAIYSTSAAKWKNIYTGAESLTAQT